VLLGSLCILRCLWPLLPFLIFAENAPLANGTACFEKYAVVYDTDFSSIIDIYFYETFFTPSPK
jgi:hypothetical protein